MTLMVDARIDEKKKSSCQNCWFQTNAPYVYNQHPGASIVCYKTGNRINSYIKRNQRAKSCPAVEVSGIGYL